jgi:hypothetical protein
MVSKHNVVDNYLNMTYIYTTYSAIFYLKLKDLDLGKYSVVI